MMVEKILVIANFVVFLIFGSLLILTQGTIFAPFVYTVFKLKYILGISSFYHDSAASI